MTNRGGKRDNAGRKLGSNDYGESTIPIRVPQSQEGVVRDFLTAFKRKRLRELHGNVIEVEIHEAGGDDVSLPLYTSKVAAGFPSPADDHVEKRLRPNQYLVQNESATFFVKVKGDSMIDAGIFDNDVLVVDRSREPQIGDIVLAVVDGEFTVKSLGRNKLGFRLLPANKAFPVIEIREGQSFEIHGVVTGSMRKFK
jgi:DNA polymerase V